MRLVLSTVLAICVMAGLQHVARAEDVEKTADPIRAHLDDAKTVHEQARKQAADALRAACDDAIAAANKDNHGDLASQIKTQEEAFTSGGTLPSLPALKKAADDYQLAIDLADSNLVRAYARAIRHYAAEKQVNQAMALEKEKIALVRQFRGDASSASDALANPAETDQNLAQAKAQYRTQVEDARQALLAKVDSRLNEEMNAGNLQAAQKFRAMEENLKSGTIPNDAGDPVVIAAMVNYRRAIHAANVRIAEAYSQAIRNLTRARQLDRAEAVQAEFVSTGLSGIDLNAVSLEDGQTPSDTTYVLGRRLPDFLSTADRWEPRANGIFLARRAFIRTKAGNYLDRDFACDFWFTIETTGTRMFIGIGDGRGRPSDDLPLNSLALVINSPDEFHGMVGFLRADGQIDPIGHLPPGDYVARIRRAGKILTFSIGDEDPDGTFNPVLSTTVTNPTVVAPFLTNHNAHLFFGGGRFWKIRYIVGNPPAVVPDTVVKSLMAP